VSSEAGDRDQREQRERTGGAGRQAHARARTGARQHQERQRDAGGDLDADARDERDGGRASPRPGGRRERERRGDREHDEGVVVSAADGRLEQDGVEAHERRRPARGAPHRAGGASDRRDRGKARRDGRGLERPQRPRDPERRRRVAREREQRPVGRVLVRPADEHERGVAGGFGGDARVRIEPVQHAHARETDVAEHVLRQQRWAEEERDVRGDDREPDRRHRQRARSEQHEQVAPAHHERECLEGIRADRAAEPEQRAREPSRPAADARGDVLGRFTGGGAREQERARDDGQRAGDRKRAFGARVAVGVRRPGRRDSPAPRLQATRARSWRCGAHARIVSAPRGTSGGVHAKL
jgi:hypothetical protein